MPFLSRLSMDSVKGQRGIITTAVLEYSSERYFTIISVPKGTYSNFGSVPAVVPPFIAPRVGRAKEAYVLHDYLYETKGERGRLSRLQSDMILYDALADLGVPAWRRAIILSGVRLNFIAGIKWP